MTAFDSLDTMLLMGLHEEYEGAMEVVKSANFSKAEVRALCCTLDATVEPLLEIY